MCLMRKDSLLVSDGKMTGNLQNSGQSALKQTLTD
jgi:hypothetical protein